jgi:hypothetical protein
MVPSSTRIWLSFQQQKLQVFHRRNWLRQPTLAPVLIRWVLPHTTQKCQFCIHGSQNTISQRARSKDNCSSKRTWPTTTCAGHRTQDRESMTSRRQAKSSSTQPARTRSSSRKCPTAKTRRKALLLQDLVRTKRSFPSRNRLLTTPGTIQTAFSSGRSHRVSCPRPKEANSGNTKEKRHIRDRHLPKIQDPVIMSTIRKKMTSKIKLSNKRLTMPLLTAVKLDPFIRK